MTIPYKLDLRICISSIPLLTGIAWYVALLLTLHFWCIWLPSQKAGGALCEGEWRIPGGKSCFHKYIPSSNDLQLWQYVHINDLSCLGILTLLVDKNKIFSSCFSSGLNKTLESPAVISLKSFVYYMTLLLHMSLDLFYVLSIDVSNYCRLTELLFMH